MMLFGADFSKDAAIIRGSGQFDPAFYQARVGRRLLNPISHYLKKGEAAGIPPSENFDPQFYRWANPDVARAGYNLLVHYVKFGRSEGRFATKPALARQVAALRSGGVVEPPVKLPPSKIAGISPIEQYVLSLGFDADFYTSRYEDVTAYHRAPIFHYLEIGRKQQRAVHPAQLKRHAAAIRPHFNHDFYRGKANLGESPVDPVEHYLTVGRFAGIDPSPAFSLKYYLRAYSDIAQSGIEPFTHYINHGVAEKRLGIPDTEKGVVRGAHIYDPSLPTILVVNHEASRTGAPLVGLEVAKHFSAEQNVFVFCLSGGELIDAFAEVSVQVKVTEANTADIEYFLRDLKTKFQLGAVILNSIETSAFAEAALYEGIPSVALIHEFAEYTFPPGRTAKAVAAVDRVVSPARLVRDSIQRDVMTQFGAAALDVVVRPQGCLPILVNNERHANDLSPSQILAAIKAPKGTRPAIVLGAGAIHMRKGVELFVQTAHEMRKHRPDVRFLWVGSGYAPASDIYSVWLAENVRRLDLQNTVFFLPQQSQLDDVFGLCDVFFLPSRLDPFPSVVLDALEAGKQVVCFEGATGAAELFTDGEARGAVVEYANVAAAAAAIADILKSDAAEAARVNHALVERKFQFDSYAAFLADQVEEAKSARAHNDEVVERLLASSFFDAGFHDGALPFDQDPVRACIEYVARESKGLSKFSPRPGFNDGLYRSRVQLEAGEVPLDHALRGSQGGAPPATHRCVQFGDTPPPAPAKPAALHIHLHYSELADEFVQRLNAAAQPVDVFATTTGGEKLAQIRTAFAGYRFGEVTCLDVPNCGRDIGPLLSVLRAPLEAGRYDIVGHLHGKRSLAVDAEMGERWRVYLLDTLLSAKLAHLLGLFAADGKLGLVFAEDRHAAGWNGNHDIAKTLAARAKPPLTVPPYPYFPLGTMFWARRAALQPLWSLDLTSEDFPAEPLPYDGTMLHAIERLLPASAEAAGLSWCTVYEPGRAW